MGVGSYLGKKSDGGDVTALPGQVKGTFGDGDTIDRAESLKGLLQNGAGLMGKLPGVAGVIGKGVSGGMSVLDKASEAIEGATGTSGYDWLGKGAAKAYDTVAGEKPAQNASEGYGPVPEGQKRIFVDGQERIVPAAQQGPNGQETPKPSAGDDPAPQSQPEQSSSSEGGDS